MIIEINTKLLDIPEVTNSNQLLFLSMVLDKNQKSNQDVRKLISLISDDDISYLITEGLVTSMERDNKKIYEPTEKLKSSLTKEEDYFDIFYNLYPVYVVRSDGSKCYLRANVNKCRYFFNTKCGRSSAMAEHIINCLKYEINKKTREGNISYMMTMWNWLTRSQWEAVEEEMLDAEKSNNTTEYGQELI